MLSESIAIKQDIIHNHKKEFKIMSKEDLFYLICEYTTDSTVVEEVYDTLYQRVNAFV